MKLTVKEVVKLLNVSERTVYRWINSGSIPVHKINERYSFNRVEVLEWATANRIPVKPEIFAEPKSENLPSLSNAIDAGGIFYRITGQDKESLLRSIVEQIRFPEEVDVEFLLQVLLAREALGSTGIGNGIAIPHPRNPIVLHIPRPMITLCFLETPIDFGAIDGRPVDTVFVLVSPTVRAHLHLLSRLAYALKSDEWRQTLSRQGNRDEILGKLRAIETQWEGK